MEDFGWGAANEGCGEVGETGTDVDWVDVDECVGCVVVDNGAGCVGAGSVGAVGFDVDAGVGARIVGADG
jgi:hypothetical protein